MTPFAVAGAIAATIVLIGAVVKAWPAVWSLVLLPGKIDAKLDKLDKLDAIEKAAHEARGAADEAREEWQGATAAVHRVAGDHEYRLKMVEDRITAVEHRVGALEQRVR